MKLILLIGFSRGIGKAIFEQLRAVIQPGKIELLAIGRNTQNLPEYNAVVYKEANLLENDCWVKLSEHIPTHVDTLDVFINASVVEPINMVGSLDSYQLEQAVQVNYISPMKLINELVSLQKKLKFNINVFNISSGAATKPIEGWSAYCSTKAGLKMFLDVVNIESGSNLSVTHIDPGVVATDMQKTIRSKSVKEMKGVQQFINLNNNNHLKTPQDAALEILKTSGNY